MIKQNKTKDIEEILKEFEYKLSNVWLSNLSDGNIGSIKSYIGETLLSQREEIWEKITDLIAKEMLIAQTEGERTSRLTSLSVKIGELFFPLSTLNIK